MLFTTAQEKKAHFNIAAYYAQSPSLRLACAKWCLKCLTLAKYSEENK